MFIMSLWDLFLIAGMFRSPIRYFDGYDSDMLPKWLLGGGLASPSLDRCCLIVG
jgi:hypothetical protein